MFFSSRKVYSIVAYFDGFQVDAKDSSLGVLRDGRNGLGYCLMPFLFVVVSLCVDNK